MTFKCIHDEGKQIHLYINYELARVKCQLDFLCMMVQP